MVGWVRQVELAAEERERFDAAFKRGRQAGQEDVCREILKHDPSFAWQIAREFLAQYGQSD